MHRQPTEKPLVNGWRPIQIAGCYDDSSSVQYLLPDYWTGNKLACGGYLLSTHPLQSGHRQQRPSFMARNDSHRADAFCIRHVRPMQFNYTAGESTFRQLLIAFQRNAADGRIFARPLAPDPPTRLREINKFLRRLQSYTSLPFLCWPSIFFSIFCAVCAPLEISFRSLYRSSMHSASLLCLPKFFFFLCWCCRLVAPIPCALK